VFVDLGFDSEVVNK